MTNDAPVATLSDSTLTTASIQPQVNFTATDADEETFSYQLLGTPIDGLTLTQQRDLRSNQHCLSGR